MESLSRSDHQTATTGHRFERPSATVTALPRRTRDRSGASAKTELSILGHRYRELDLQFEEEEGILWTRFRHNDRPCYTPELLSEIEDMQARLRDLLTNDRDCPLRYLVWASEHPSSWNLGGDLVLFTDLIRKRDEAALRGYAHRCINVLSNNYRSLDLPIVTVALVQGSALGGGFEAALSDDLIVAEKGCQFGLPEILFNLFPGMGAFSFLSRRLGAAEAERMIMSGRIFKAEELHEMGVVDVLADPGEAEVALLLHIARHRRRHNAQVAMRQVRERCQPISHSELVDVTDLWVDTAMRLDAMDLRKMDRLAAAQRRQRRHAMTA